MASKARSKFLFEHDFIAKAASSLRVMLYRGHHPAFAHFRYN